MSSSSLKGVVIGAGYFSQFQCAAWQQIPEVTITAVSDFSASKGTAFQQRFGIERYYADYQEMLITEQPDFVDIVTPPQTHYEISKYAAELGIHVICQKPLAPTYAESIALVEAVEATGVRFMVHENWRWKPWYREIKKLLDENLLGAPFSLYFQMRTGDGWPDDAYLSRQPYFRDYERLLMFETGVHFVDTFRYLFGEIATVYARLQRRNRNIKGEDSGQVVYGFDGGKTAVFDSNRYNENEATNPFYTFGNMRLDGAKGHLDLDTAGNLFIKPLAQATYQHEYCHDPTLFGGGCVYNLQRHFVDCMFSGEQFENNGQDYLKTIQVVERTYQSTAENQVVMIEP